MGLWIGILVSIIILGTIIQVGYELMTQQTRCLNSIAEKYPNISCGSAQVIYCVWENKTYSIVMYQEESKVWCDLTEYHPTFQDTINNLKPLGLVFVVVVIVGLIGLIGFNGKEEIKGRRKR
jgi:hypothetical protein